MAYWRMGNCRRVKIFNMCSFTTSFMWNEKKKKKEFYHSTVIPLFVYSGMYFFLISDLTTAVCLQSNNFSFSQLWKQQSSPIVLEQYALTFVTCMSTLCIFSLSEIPFLLHFCIWLFKTTGKIFLLWPGESWLFSLCCVTNIKSPSIEIQTTER